MKIKSQWKNTRFFYLRLGFFVLFLGVIFCTYRIGYRQGIHSESQYFFPHQEEISNLQEEHQGCWKKVNELTQVQLSQENELAVEQEKLKVLTDNLHQIQVQNRILSEENQLYKNILAPEYKKTGIQINSLQIFPMNQAGKYRYSVLLAKFEHHKTRTLGKMLLSLQGIHHDEAIQIPFEVLNTQTPKGHPFNIQYFQVLEGEINIPETFKPESIQISLFSESKAIKSSTEEFPWLVTYG